MEMLIVRCSTDGEVRTVSPRSFKNWPKVKGYENDPNIRQGVNCTWIRVRSRRTRIAEGLLRVASTLRRSPSLVILRKGLDWLKVVVALAGLVRLIWDVVSMRTGA